MHFTRSLLFALVAPLAAWAQSTANPFTATPAGASAGDTVKLTWTPTTEGTVTLTLRSGNPGDLDVGTVIVSSIANSGSYTWTIPSDTINGGSYAVEIKDDSDAQDVNYTGPFAIRSSNIATTSSSVSSSATSTTSDSSSSPTPSAFGVDPHLTTTINTTPPPKSSSTTAPATTVVTSTRSTDSSATSSTSSQTGSTTSCAQTSTSSQADLQASSTTSPNSAARATAMVGMLGAVALGALAL